MASDGRSDSPHPGRSYRIRVRPWARTSHRCRSGGSAQLSSRWLSQPPMSSSGGPAPAVAYTTSRPPARWVELSCCSTRPSALSTYAAGTASCSRTRRATGPIVGCRAKWGSSTPDTRLGSDDAVDIGIDRNEEDQGEHDVGGHDIGGRRRCGRQGVPRNRRGLCRRGLPGIPVGGRLRRALPGGRARAAHRRWRRTCRRRRRGGRDRRAAPRVVRCAAQRHGPCDVQASADDRRAASTSSARRTSSRPPWSWRWCSGSGGPSPRCSGGSTTRPHKPCCGRCSPPAGRR